MSFYDELKKGIQLTRTVVYRYRGVYVIIGVASKMSTHTKPGLGMGSGLVFPCVSKIPGTKGCMLLGSDSCIAICKNSCTRDIYIYNILYPGMSEFCL